MELTVNPAGPAAGPGTLSEVQAALEAFWSLHDEVPVGVRIEIEIAASEIAANIVEHCCPAGLRMELHILLNEVQVEFTDTGAPVAVDLDAVCMPDEMAERGRGMAMARAALRLLSYFRDEVGNHWKLVQQSVPRHRESMLTRASGFPAARSYQCDRYGPVSAMAANVVSRAAAGSALTTLYRERACAPTASVK